MTSKDFVSQVRASIVEDNVAAYRELLTSTQREQARDPYWRSLQGLHGRLSPADRDVLYALMRQVTVDAISSLFAIIDGSARMDGQTEDLQLVTATSRARLDGSLQDLFLELVESAPATR